MLRLVSWWKELQLPRWMLHAGLAASTAAGGYLLHAVRAQNDAKEALLDRLVQVEIPAIHAKDAVQDIQLAGHDGSLQRMERKLDLTLEAQNQLSRSVARIEAKLDRMGR